VNDRDRDQGDEERDTVIVERSAGGGLIAAIALVIAVLALLHYFDLLPI
jgi:hypothetical protein